MSTLFGPQLIGETEKALNAILLHSLRDTGLSEPHWVSLRLASSIDGDIDADRLAAAIADRARFANAAELVEELTTLGLLHDGRPTAAGRLLVHTVQTAIAETTAPIWRDLSADDVAAATRVLDEVRSRARQVLART